MDMINYKAELKKLLWDDFDDGLINEDVLDMYLKLLLHAKEQYCKGLLDSYIILRRL
jgi:hypothetical protein